MAKGIGGHTLPTRGRTDDWITPKFIIDRLGPFDLDPCQSLTQPWPCAAKGYTVKDDGLKQRWGKTSRVWCNSPYGPEAGPFLDRMAKQRSGISLIFARTETKMFQDSVWQHAHAILFLLGRLHFHYPDIVDPVICKRDDEHVWAPRPESPKTQWCTRCGRAKGNSGGPSIFISYSEYDTRRLRDSGFPGALVTSWDMVPAKLPKLKLKGRKDG